MKTTVYSILFFTLLCLAALYLTSCKPNEQSPCQSASNTIVDLTSNELNKIPYNGHDTLYFKDINGDTNIVVGGGKQFYYDITYATVPPDCPQNQSAKYQRNDISFNTQKGNLSFMLSQKLIDRRVYLLKNNYPVFPSLRFDFIGSTYKVFIDSIIINGYRYDSVYVLKAYDTSYIAYINQTHGLLYIKSSNDNEEYSLIKK